MVAPMAYAFAADVEFLPYRLHAATKTLGCYEEPFSMTMLTRNAGHYSMGGDPGRDLFTSPGDPLFYLHHGGIDRTWWIWQQLDRKTRTGASGIAGTGTFLNTPPSADTTLDTVIDLGFAAGPPVTMADLMSTTDGPMCYIYM
jgi:tyrosinase